MRQEVEDHLGEDIASAPAGDPLEAARHAIANFGEPNVIAAQFAVVSLAAQTRRVGLAVMLVIAGVFVAMKARLEWYALTQWTLSEDLRAVSAVVGAIDRYAFWLSVLVGVAALVYMRSWGTPAFDPAYRHQVHRFFVLSTVATSGLIASVIADGVLTTLRLFNAEWSVDALIPIFSMVIEIIFAGVLVLHVRRFVRRTASTAALLRTLTAGPGLGA